MPQTFRNIVEEFRQQILAKDADAVILLLKEYASVIARIRQDLDRLIQTIEKLRRENRLISEYDLYREYRYKEFIIQLRREMTDYAKLVTETVSSLQKEAISLAFAQTDALINFTYKELPSGVLESFTRFDEYAARNITVKLNNETYLKRLTDQFEQQALLGIKQLLIDGVITGRSTKSIKTDLIKRFEIIPNKAETIARTEVLSAYRDANLERYRLSTTVKAWQWSATLDERTCPVCIALDGQEFSLATPFATHPNCRCSPIPITYSFDELGMGYLNLKEPKPPYMGKRGEEWFRSQPVHVQERILGKTKYELFKEGQISLQDLVQSFTHPVYGPSRQERSLKSLKALKIIY